MINRCNPPKTRPIQAYKTDPIVLQAIHGRLKGQKGQLLPNWSRLSPIHGNNEVASGLMGLGGHAEVYDAEMAALVVVRKFGLVQFRGTIL